MNPKQLLYEDDAVSPVIGVVLMVAITVILAAVIGTAVVGLGSEQSATTPQASFAFDVDDHDGDGDTHDVQVTHEGGDTLPADEITVKSTAGSTTDPSATYSEVTAGDNWVAVNDIPEGETVRIVWENPENEKSTTIGKFTR